MTASDACAMLTFWGQKLTGFHCCNDLSFVSSLEVVPPLNYPHLPSANNSLKNVDFSHTYPLMNRFVLHKIENFYEILHIYFIIIFLCQPGGDREKDFLLSCC